MYNHLFNCESAEDYIINDFQAIFIPKINELLTENNDILIGKHVYKRNIALEEVDVIVRILRTHWMSIQNVALCDSVMPYEEMRQSRKILNNSFLLLTAALTSCDLDTRKTRYKNDILKYLDSLTSCVVQIGQLEEDFRLKITTAKNLQSPVYQYYHSFLEIQYHILKLSYVCDVNQIKLENIIRNIVVNLMLVSHTFYNRMTNTENIFVCSCNKNMWLIMQLFCDKVRPENFFWEVFNSVMENEEPLFSIWLLKDVSMLQLVNSNFEEEDNTCSRIRPNYELLVNKLKMFLTDADPEILKKLFGVIDPLVCNVWIKHAKIEVYQYLWDYYSKRLNISNKNFMNLTATDFNIILEKIACKLDSDEHFEIFTKLLITHLKEHPHHWGKMKGRIYSQLGPNKVKELTEIGMSHVMILFIALTNINHDELVRKILAFMESLPKDKYSGLTWNLYTAFVFQETSKGQSLEKVAVPLVQLLNEASCDNKSFRLIKDFVTNFEYIIKTSTNLQNQQWLFLDFWLGKYLNTCYLNDLNYTLGVLSLTLKRVCDVDCWIFWESAFKEHVYPTLKTLATQNNPSGIVGSIAGDLCLLIPQMSNEIFIFFNGETISPKVLAQFLKVVLKNYPVGFMLSQQQECLVVQTWIKVCFLAIDHSEDVTKDVLKLDCFPTLLKSHIAKSQDPVYAFIEYLGSDIKHHLQSTTINKLCDLSFGQADKWVAHYLSHPDQEELVQRVYTCISLAFLHCGQLLYSRNKSSCPLTRLLQATLLSTDFLIGKPLHQFVLSAVKKTWHLFFEALVKLNTDSDMFLERSLRDMITKYMQYFSTVDSPVIKCIQNETTAPVILEKISNSYMKHPVKESDANIMKVLKILGDIASSTTSVKLLQLIVNKTMYGLFELVIFHAQKNTAINVIRIITASHIYPQVRIDVSNAIITVTEKHMAFNTINYFQLMNVLAKFIPGDIRNRLLRIKQQVANVERLRGVGFDKNLRLQLEKLEDMLKENS